MTYDFRASQIQTNRIIVTGSTGTGASLLIYPFSADGAPANQGNINTAIFGTGSIGTDVFLFVSGAKGSIGGSSHGVTVFGGDVVVSGTFRFASGSQVTGRITVGNYTTTTNTSGSPQVCGENYWNPTEVGAVAGTSTITFRSILSTNTGSNKALVQLWNVTSLVFVDIGGPGITVLSSSATTPTRVESVNLGAAGVVGFSTSSAAIYEVQLYTSGAGLAATLGMAELLNT